MSHDEAKRFAEASANGLLIGQRKNADDTLDGFGGIDGVKSGHHQMAGLGSFQGDFNGFAVAHFANENDLRRLTQSGAQGESKSRGVGMQFTLGNGAFFVAMQKLDRIFDGKNARGEMLSHAVEDGSES